MLFLLRPRQTWMPYAIPRSGPEQAQYNRQLEDAYASTRRVAPAALDPAVSQPRDPVADLKDLAALHESGALSDAEFSAAKAKVLDSERDAP